jgi:hypothetical protein
MIDGRLQVFAYWVPVGRLMLLSARAHESSEQVRTSSQGGSVKEGERRLLVYPSASHDTSEKVEKWRKIVICPRPGKQGRRLQGRPKKGSLLRKPCQLHGQPRVADVLHA